MRAKMSNTARAAHRLSRLPLARSMADERRVHEHGPRDYQIASDTRLKQDTLPGQRTPHIHRAPPVKLHSKKGFLARMFGSSHRERPSETHANAVAAAAESMAADTRAADAAKAADDQLRRRSSPAHDPRTPWTGQQQQQGVAPGGIDYRRVYRPTAPQVAHPRPNSILRGANAGRRDGRRVTFGEGALRPGDREYEYRT